MLTVRQQVLEVGWHFHGELVDSLGFVQIEVSLCHRVELDGINCCGRELLVVPGQRSLDVGDIFPAVDDAGDLR